MKRRELLIGAASIPLAAGLAACSSGVVAQATKVDSLTIFLTPSPTEDAIKKMIPDYEKLTGIKFTVVDAPYDDAHQKQLLSFKSKQGAYDIVQFDNPFLATYGDQGDLLDLTSRVKASAKFAYDDFVPGLQQYGVYQDKLIGLDLSTEPFLFWYRKDIYAQLALTVPTTWDQYYDNAKKIQDSGKADGQIIAFANPVNSWWWLQFLWSFGGDLTDAAGNPTVATPQAIAATDYYKKLLAVSPKSAISSNGDDATSLFITQNVGQMITYSGYWPTIMDPQQSKNLANIGYAATPKGTTDIVQLTGWNIGVPSDSKKQDAAWAFLEWLVGKDGSKALLQAGGAAIGRTSMAADTALVKDNPYLPLLPAAATNGRRLPALVQWPEVSNQIGIRVADVMTGKAQTQASLTDLNADLARILGK
jgi:multiple sugar transport system substrate-binding protein